MSFKKLNLTNSVGNNLANTHSDVLTVKDVLRHMGRLRLDEQKAEPHGYVTRDLDDALKVYQKERGLRIDGIMFPGGETQENLNKDLRRMVSEEEDEESEDASEEDEEEDENENENENMPATPPPVVEKEDVAPSNIPGTNIPDRGIPEQGEERHEIQGDKDRWRYEMDSGINIEPPVMDPYFELDTIHAQPRGPYPRR